MIEEDFRIDKYTKITYESDPIGKERIVLQLTTLDLEAFEKDKKLEKIPTKIVAKAFEIPGKLEENSAVSASINACNQRLFEAIIKKFIVDTYEEQISNMKKCIEMNRKIPQTQCYNLQSKGDRSNE